MQQYVLEILIINRISEEKSRLLGLDGLIYADPDTPIKREKRFILWNFARLSEKKLSFELVSLIILSL